MALGEDDDGTLHVAAATPTDLGGLGRPARLSLAPAEEVEALLAPFGERPPADPPQASSPSPAPVPVPGDATALPGSTRDAAPGGRPQPATPSPDAASPPRVGRPAQDAPPSRRRRAWLLLGLLLLLTAAGAAAAVLWLRQDRPAGPPAGAVAVADELPAAVAERLPAPVRRVPAQAALDDLCDDRARAAVVPVPVPATRCRARAAATVTTRATTLAAPGGGCVGEARARELATALAGRAGAPVPARSRPVGVRAAASGACVAPTPATIGDGTYPLAQRAVLLVTDRRVAPSLLGPLRAVADGAPVTELGLRRALG